jgi:hypothetical protein
MKVFSLSVFFLVILIIPAASSAQEAYPVPDLTKAKLVLDENQLAAKGGPAINIQTFRNPDGSETRAYSVGGKIFRYDVRPTAAGPYEYRLLDRDGDGRFETKEPLVGEMVVRDRGRRYYIDLGPEPGKEYRYEYEERAEYDARHLSSREEKRVLEGFPIYIPQWALPTPGKP